MELTKKYLPLQSQTKRGTQIFEGSIAQLVQSVCLTSRGSGVRLPLLPPKKAIQEPESLFSYNLPPNPRPSATKRHQPRIGGRSFHRKRRTEMPDDVKDGIGMPPGAVAKRLGVKRKDAGLPASGVRLPLLPPKKRVTKNEFLVARYRFSSKN